MICLNIVTNKLLIFIEIEASSANIYEVISTPVKSSIKSYQKSTNSKFLGKKNTINKKKIDYKFNNQTKVLTLVINNILFIY